MRGPVGHVHPHPPQLRSLMVSLFHLYIATVLPLPSHGFHPRSSLAGQRQLLDQLQGQDDAGGGQGPAETAGEVKGEGGGRMEARTHVLQGQYVVGLLRT